MAKSKRRDQDTNDVPGEEVVAATDEFFKRQPVPPIEPKVPEDSQTPLSHAEEGEVPSPEDATVHPALHQDYVRELQQEFEEQQEEGKV